MYKFKIGDTVKVTAGKDKGKEGKIEKVFGRNNTVLIPQINLFKKHVKPNLTADGKGGIFDIPRPLSVGNIALICPNCKKQTRVGFSLAGETKVRICRKCGRTVDLKEKRNLSLQGRKGKEKK